MVETYLKNGCMYDLSISLTDVHIDKTQYWTVWDSFAFPILCLLLDCYLDNPSFIVRLMECKST